MPKVRSPNRDKAFELYKQHNGDIALVDIAKQLGETAGTIRGWKSKDKWDEQLNGTFQTKNMERSKKNKSENKKVKKETSSIYEEKNNMPIMGTNDDSKTNSIQIVKNRGAPKGNQNAVGNAGGIGAPIGNKFAVTTGEYETILFDDLLDETELKIFAQDIDVEMELDIDIRFDRVREHRMMQRIKSLENSVDKNGNKKSMAISSVSVMQSKDNKSQLTTTQSISMLDVLIKHEDALNRVKSSKLRTAKELHKIRNDNTRLGMEAERLAAYKGKVTGVLFEEIENDEEDITFD